MRRSHGLYLEDILGSICKIQEYVGNLDLSSFIKDGMCVDAVVRNLEIIGDAAKNIPQEVKNKYPSIEWTKISNFRNILAHEYFGIDNEILWDIVKNKLPKLQNQINTIIEQ